MSFLGRAGGGGRDDRSRNPNDLTNYILQISHLQTQPNSNEAQDLLHRAGKAVLPLLQRRKWKIGHLTEFYPNNPSLHGLNINQGHMIKVRLRTSESQHEFLPLDYIIGTLIHEITHISIGPHSAEFYKLMESLTAEVEQDLASGVDLNGNLKFAAFTGVARRLGVSNSNSCGQATPFDKKRLRDLQMEAAIRREQNLNRSQGSGQVLGGRSITSLSSGVPSSSRLLQMNQTQGTGGHVRTERQTGREPLQGLPETRPLPRFPDSTGKIEGSWACVSCTYQNLPGNSLCEICGASSKHGVSSSVWCCPLCTFENTSSLEVCQICGGNRHSSSLPTSSDPNVVTLEDDLESRSPPSRRLRGRRDGGGEDLDGELECLWICSMCQGANAMRETSCGICGYLA